MQLVDLVRGSICACERQFDRQFAFRREESVVEVFFTRHAEEARAELSRGSQKKEEVRGERLEAKERRLTQHSLNCFASMGDVKFKPQVSLVIGSFQ